MRVSQRTSERDFVVIIYSIQVIVQLEFLLERALLFVDVVEDDSALEKLSVSFIVHQALVRGSVHSFMEVLDHWVFGLARYPVIVVTCLSKH